MLKFQKCRLAPAKRSDKYRLMLGYYYSTVKTAPIADCSITLDMLCNILSCIAKPMNRICWLQYHSICIETMCLKTFRNHELNIAVLCKQSVNSGRVKKVRCCIPMNILNEVFDQLCGTIANQRRVYKFHSQ